MEKNEKIQKIKEAIELALSKYNTSEVDIVKDIEYIDIMYHSRHNSFPIVSNVCLCGDLTEKDISEIADTYDIGYVW